MIASILPFLIAIALALIFSVILFITLRIISNRVTNLGIYHKEESKGTRLRLLYETYLSLSVPVLFIVYVTLRTNFPNMPLTEILPISFAMSFMIPLFGRISSLGSRYTPRDVEEARRLVSKEKEDLAWKRENERVLSFLYAIIGSTLILTMIVAVYLVMFVNQPYQLRAEIAPRQAFVAVLTFLAAPLLTSVIGEIILYFLEVPNSLKI